MLSNGTLSVNGLSMAVMKPYTGVVFDLYFCSLGCQLGISLHLNLFHAKATPVHGRKMQKR